MRAALGTAFALLVAGVLAFGFYLTGGPAENRALRLDETRRAALGEILRGVESFAAERKALPAALEDLRRHFERNAVIFNLRLNLEEFSYRPLEPEEGLYELCAVFLRPSPAQAPLFDGRSLFASHPAGRHCFVIDASEPGPLSKESLALPPAPLARSP